MPVLLHGIPERLLTRGRAGGPNPLAPVQFDPPSCRIPWVDPYRTPAEIIALTLLDRDGVSAIWTLHLCAALAHRDGHRSVARGIIDIADAAEREWLRAKAAVKGSPG
jgi:hypothetical protein